MRVLSVVNDLGHRGTPRVAQDYALGLKHAGVDVAVLAHAEGGPREQVLADAGVPVWIGGNTLDEALRRGCEYGADIIHFHRRGLPSRHESAMFRRLKTDRNRILETNVFGRFDCTPDARLIDVHLQLSKWNLYRWRRWSRHDPSLAGVVLPNPVSTKSFCRASSDAVSAFRATCQISAGMFVCGRVGKWSPDLFRAFVLLAEKRPNVALLCVDDGEDVRGAVESLVPAHVRAQVRFVPKLLDNASLATFYSSLDCLLHASPIGESFGLVMAEAMSCGVPVVTAARPHKDNAQIEVVACGGRVAACARLLPEVLVRFHDSIRDRPFALDSGGIRQSIVARFDTDSVVARFLGIADLALRYPDRGSLCHALRCSPDIVCDFGHRDAMSLLATCDGAASWFELMQMSAIHHPRVYRIYQAVKTFGGAGG